MHRRLLVALAVALLALAAIPPAAPVDYLGTCSLFPLGWAHEEGVRLDSLLPDEVRVGTPFVFPSNASGYIMFYAAGATGWESIRVALSSDGVNWTRLGVSFIAASDFGVLNILEPFVIQGTDGALYMYVEGWNVFETVGARGIYRARSLDGALWVANGLALSGSPSDDWPASPVIEHLAPGDPNGTFRMYYTGLDTGSMKRRMLTAVSPDGIAWAKEGVVLSPGGADTNGPLRVALNEERAGYRLYYSEYGVENAILTAVSANGVAWAKRGPVLGLGPQKGNNVNVSAPSVVQPDDGHGRMYFMATGTASSDYQIFSALTSTSNRDPLAEAGSPQQVPVGSTVTVNASASADPDPIDSLSFLWMLLDKPPNSTAFLSSPLSAVTDFAADLPGQYTLLLLVGDDCGGAGIDFTFAVAVNQPPAAVPTAWPAATRPVDSAVTLDAANSSDPEGGLISLEWSLDSKPAGSSLAVPNVSASNFTVVLDAVGDFVFRLNVTDPFGGTDSETLTVLSINRDPVVSINTQPSGQVSAGTPVAFNATASSDPDGHPLAFSWLLTTQPAGSNATLTGNATAVAGLVPDRAGVFVVSVTASDPWNGSATLPAVLLAVNAAPVPVVTVSPSTAVPLFTTVLLDASGSTDPEGHAFTFTWSLDSRPPGSTAALANVTGPTAELTPDTAGTYTASVTLLDAYGASSQGFVAVTGFVTPPYADAGPDLSVLVGTPAVLDGSASSAPGGSPLTFSWSFVLRPAASPAILANADQPVADFIPDVVGSYIVELNVTVPATGANSTDAAIVVATNSAPTVTACCDAVVLLGTNASVDATAGDPDPGHTLTYTWEFLAKPAGSSAVLADPAQAATTFPVDTVGAYIARVTATDPFGASASALVTVLSNRAPTPLPLVLPASSVLIGTAVTLDGNNSYDPDGDAIIVSWTLDDWPGRATGTPAPATQLLAPALLRVNATLLGSFAATLSAVDAHGAGSSAVVTFATYNNIPLALAACDAQVSIGRNATCSASGSSDVDPGQSLTYAWAVVAQPPGSLVSFGDPAGTSTAIALDAVGNYTFALTVTDDWGASAQDTFAIAVVNAPPISVAGSDRTVVLSDGGLDVTLDASSSSDPDGHAIAFAWTVLRYPGAAAPALSDPASPTPTFVATLSGEYEFSVTVTDAYGLSSVDAVLITADIAPVANAGLNVTAAPQASVELDASASYDPDAGDAIASWAWWVVSQPPGSRYVLTNGSAQVTFSADTPGVYGIRLRVTDTGGAVGYDTLFVSVERPTDLLPLVALLVLAAALVGLVGFLLYRRSRIVIEDLFLLGKNGILIKHYTRRLKPGADSDILSAMLVAVQNFVDDAFQRMDAEAKPLEQFKFGDQTMLIAKGEHLFIAALASGPNPRRLLPKISETLRTIEEELGEVLKDWSGDMADVGAADAHMESLLGIRKKK
ncbi:MAG TPA: hypothetical protein VJ397_09565 [Thermoplasmata archaeon]|nr:hypothetical protein [Thermoplasmata archaeon]